MNGTLVVVVRLRSHVPMSIELAEKLKETLTDKFVLVDSSIPELKRFANWTGKVKTVNMNCRALVEFDGPVDIGWYDIDPAYLTVVDAPVKKVALPAAAAKAPAATKTTSESTKPSAKPVASGGKSPLDAIRAQQAAKAAAPATTGAKPSPLDMIRKQGAAKATGTAAAEAVSATSVAPAPVTQVAATSVQPTASTPAPIPKAAIPTTGPDGKPLSKLDLIRMQGAKKQ